MKKELSNITDCNLIIHGVEESPGEKDVDSKRRGNKFFVEIITEIMDVILKAKSVRDCLKIFALKFPQNRTNYTFREI